MVVLDSVETDAASKRLFEIVGRARELEICYADLCGGEWSRLYSRSAGYAERLAMKAKVLADLMREHWELSDKEK